jgi:hypothetical protein
MRHILLNDLKAAKAKLIVLYILNTTDMVFTTILLRSGFAMEVNPLMKTVVEKPAAWYMKIIGVGLLLIWIYGRLRAETNARKIRIANKLILAAVGFYAVINTFHVIWCCIALRLISL